MGQLQPIGALGMSGSPESALDRLAADASRHLLTGPAGEAELRRLEQSLGVRLPAGFRALLARLGGGILYDRHELFGPRPLQLHDIEFVPSLAAMQRRLGSALAPGMLAFHRGEGMVHTLYLRSNMEDPVAVLSLDGTSRYTDFESFLEAVVLAPYQPSA